MKFGVVMGQNHGRTVSGRLGHALFLFLMVFVILFCAGCHRSPDAAPLPPGEPMSPAQAATARAQVINNDTRLSPLQKKQALQRLGVQSGR